MYLYWGLQYLIIYEIPCILPCILINKYFDLKLQVTGADAG